MARHGGIVMRNAVAQSLLMLLLVASFAVAEEQASPTLDETIAWMAEKTNQSFTKKGAVERAHADFAFANKFLDQNGDLCRLRFENTVSISNRGKSDDVVRISTVYNVLMSELDPKKLVVDEHSGAFVLKAKTRNGKESVIATMTAKGLAETPEETTGMISASELSLHFPDGHIAERYKNALRHAIRLCSQ